MLPGYYSQEHPDEVQVRVSLYEAVSLSVPSGQRLYTQTLMYF